MEPSAHQQRQVNRISHHGHAPSRAVARLRQYRWQHSLEAARPLGHLRLSTPYFDERTLLASIARRRHRLEAPEKPSMIDAKDESSPMPAADEIRSAFGQVMAAI